MDSNNWEAQMYNTGVTFGNYSLFRFELLIQRNEEWTVDSSKTATLHIKQLEYT